MVLKKITFASLLLSIFALPCFAQNPPCDLTGHEIRGSCLPNEGKCPASFVLMAVSELSIQCVRLQPVKAEVSVKSSSVAPASSPELALNERLAPKGTRKPQKFGETFLGGKKARIISDAVYWGGVIADQASSRNYEQNPLLRNDAGKLNVPKYYLIHGGVFAFLKFLERKLPEVANSIKLVFGIAHSIQAWSNVR